MRDWGNCAAGLIGTLVMSGNLLVVLYHWSIEVRLDFFFFWLYSRLGIWIWVLGFRFFEKFLQEIGFKNKACRWVQCILLSHGYISYI